MTMSSKPTRPMQMLLAVAFVATQLAAVSAEARDARQRQGPSRPHGDYTHQSQVQRTTSGHTLSDTWTNAQGRTASRDAVVVNDKQTRARTRSRNVTATGFNGGTRAVDDDLQRAEYGYSRQTTITHPDGNVSSRNVTAAYDSTNNAWSKDVSVNRASGD